MTHESYVVWSCIKVSLIFAMTEIKLCIYIVFFSLLIAFRKFDSKKRIIFIQELEVDSDLYAYVFGESVLNDAVWWHFPTHFGYYLMY